MVQTRNPIGVEFLRTEVKTAFVFAKIAADAKDKEKRRRNVYHARKGYETLLYFCSQLLLSADEQDEMRKNLEELHRQLVVLGESLICGPLNPLHQTIADAS
jgi:hypothetical protein